MGHIEVKVMSWIQFWERERFAVEIQIYNQEREGSAIPAPARKCLDIACLFRRGLLTQLGDFVLRLFAYLEHIFYRALWRHGSKAHPERYLFFWIPCPFPFISFSHLDTNTLSIRVVFVDSPLSRFSSFLIPRTSRHLSVRFLRVFRKSCPFFNITFLVTPPHHARLVPSEVRFPSHPSFRSLFLDDLFHWQGGSWVNSNFCVYQQARYLGQRILRSVVVCSS